MHILLVRNFDSFYSIGVGGIPVQELNRLEMEFLLLLDFNLVVSVEELLECGNRLVDFQRDSLLVNESLKSGISHVFLSDSSRSSIASGPLAISTAQVSQNASTDALAQQPRPMSVDPSIISPAPELFSDQVSQFSFNSTLPSESPYISRPSFFSRSRHSDPPLPSWRHSFDTSLMRSSSSFESTSPGHPLLTMYHTWMPNPDTLLRRVKESPERISKKWVTLKELGKLKCRMKQRRALSLKEKK